MRVERLDLVAYGHYTDTRLELSRPERGLTVISGPNEAGKSTARRALVAALFGFERNDPGAYRHGRTGLRLGVRLSGTGGELSFVRQGISQVLDESGATLGEDTVARFCGGIGRVLFTRLFSVDHDELRSGSEALLDAEGEIGRLVYGASLGSGSVAAVLRRLDDRAATLFYERGRAQQIPKALDAYRSTMKRATAARVRSREWERRRQAVDEAADRLAGVRRMLDQARAEQGRLQRIRSARPLLARRAEMARRLGELGTPPSAQWAQQAAEAVSAYRDNRVALDRATAEHDQLVTEIAGIDVAEAVLERAARIDSLVEGVARYRKDTDDLTRRRVELDAIRAQLAAQLRVLGRADDDGRIVAEADLMVVEELVRRREGLDTDERSVHDELQKARQQVAATRARLSALAEPADVAALERVLKVARPALDRAGEVAAERARQAAAAADLAAHAGRLGLGARRWDEIEALRVPAPSDIDAERARRQSHRQLLDQIAGERAKLTAAVESLEGEIATLGTALPDPERLGAARRHRDIGWRLVRSTLEGVRVDTTWAGAIALADAYEAAVADADQAADERYEHADALATLTQLRARLEQATERRLELDDQEAALLADDSAATARWSATWGAIGVEPGTPEAMAEWLRDQRQLVTEIAAWRRDTTKLDATGTEIARIATTVAAVLAEAGYAPCSADLELLVAQAEQLAEEAHALAEQRRQALTELRLAEQAEPQREAALARHDEAVARWQAAWETALGPLSLDASTSPSAATAAMAAYRKLMSLRAELTSLEHRIDGMRADRRAYEQQVVAVASAVLPPDAVGLLDGGGTRGADDPLGTVAELKRRLAAAREAQQHHARLAQQLEQKTLDLRQAAVRLDEARRVLGVLRAEAGPSMDRAGDTPPAELGQEPDIGFDAAIARARQAALLRERIDQIESDLLAGGGGRSLEQIVAEASMPPDSHPRVDPEGSAAVDSHAAVDPDGSAAVDPDGHAGVVPDSHPVVDPDSHPVVDPDSHPVVDPDSGPAPDLDSHAGVDDIAQIGAKRARTCVAADGAALGSEQATDAVPVSDSLDGAIDTASFRVDALQQQLEEATTEHAGAMRAFAEVTDAATAADLEQDAQGELALAAELATEYSRTALAAEVLRRTIAEYGERHRGPLLGRAAELFRELSDGAFADLVPDADGDRHVLLAKRRGGELCTTAALSDGTRDQLYLALRLAGIEHQLTAVDDPPPVVLDDILVHFDDTRATAALRTLGSLGQQTQVLLFTHHERVVELAREALSPDSLAVVRLASRDHDQPPATTGTTSRPPGKTSTAPATTSKRSGSRRRASA